MFSTNSVMPPIRAQVFVESMFSTKFAVLSTDFVESSSSLNIHFSEKISTSKLVSGTSPINLAGQIWSTSARERARAHFVYSAFSYITLSIFGLFQLFFA